jgi:hypothetical protein
VRFNRAEGKRCRKEAAPNAAESDCWKDSNGPCWTKEGLFPAPRYQGTATLGVARNFRAEPSTTCCPIRSTWARSGRVASRLLSRDVTGDRAPGLLLQQIRMFARFPAGAIGGCDSIHSERLAHGFSDRCSGFPSGVCASKTTRQDYRFPIRPIRTLPTAQNQTSIGSPASRFW